MGLGLSIPLVSSSRRIVLLSGTRPRCLSERSRLERPHSACRVNFYAPTLHGVVLNFFPRGACHRREGALRIRLSARRSTCLDVATVALQPCCACRMRSASFLAEGAHELVGVDRPYAAYHAGGEVFLDAVCRSRRRCAQLRLFVGLGQQYRVLMLFASQGEEPFGSADRAGLLAATSFANARAIRRCSFRCLGGRCRRSCRTRPAMTRSMR